MGFIFVALKKLDGYKAPDDGAVSRTLPGAMDWKLFAMAIEFAGDFV